MKKLTLGLCIVSTTTALAHDLEYRVCKGDTLSTIAKKFHVSGKTILHANDLAADHKMRPGGMLLIPGVGDSQARTAGTSASNGLYVVRNGDVDWTLAVKHGISVHKLHLANPGVDWNHLKIGLRIHFPSDAKVRTQHTAVAISHPAAHSSKVVATKGVHMHAHWHVVEHGENDWLIAHKASIRLPLLKALNPEIDVANLKPGMKVRVPGSAVTKLALRVPRIHSTHVAVNTDAVTIRTKPGLGATSICTVDQGTRAAVVDRDGNWYQLKFPKGTVGWVRGDLLKPVHVLEVAQTERRTHHEAAHVHHSYVAEVHHSTESAHHSHHAATKHTVVAVEHHSHPTAKPHHEMVAKAHRHHGVTRNGEHVATSEMTAMDTDSGDAGGVLKSAESFKGVRYRWGAASRGATDCSGFTSQVYASNGIHLPRVSRDQAGVGSHVAYNDLKPGDLVFFHTMRGHRITHVAIYKGNGKFIHASSGGGHVQENSLNEGYYHNHFATARRILKHKAHKSTESAPSKEVEKAKPVEAEAKPEVEPNPGTGETTSDKSSE